MKLHFRKEGQGHPLVIVHGLYGSSDNWQAISKKLSARYTVYSLDLRNHGRSPHHPEHTYKAMKNDLAEFFDYHHIEEAVLMGHSMGGKTAMLYASDYPERIKKLIVVDIAPRDYLYPEQESQYHLHRTILLAMMEVDFNYVRSRQDVEDLLAEKIDNARIRQFLIKSVGNESNSSRLKWKVNIEALYNNLEEIVQGGNYKDFEDRIPITAYPVIFIRGLLSPYIRDNDLDLLKKIYPEASVVDIPDAGHWLHAEQPELFLEAVMRCC